MTCDTEGPFLLGALSVLVLALIFCLLKLRSLKE